MSRIFREIFCGHFPWKLKYENLRNISPKFRRIFRRSLRKTSQELRSGGLRAQLFGADWSLFSAHQCLCGATPIPLHLTAAGRQQNFPRKGPLWPGWLLLAKPKPKFAKLKNLLMPLFLMGCFPVDFQEVKRPLAAKSGKRPIKVGKRPISEGKRPIKAMVLVGISVSCLMGCFRASRPWWKTAPLKRPIKRSMISPRFDFPIDAQIASWNRLAIRNRNLNRL